MKSSFALSLLFVGVLVSATWSQDTTDSTADAKPEIDAAKQKLYDKFAEKMNGVKLIGQFTVVGKEQDKLPKEEYTIKSVKKLPKGEKWLFQANIKYGKKDVTVPLPIDVEWAGSTPVISLTNFTIPGMGTFSSRVVIYKNKYAGTWTHDAVGGHMFGTVEKVEASEKKTESTSDAPAQSN